MKICPSCESGYHDSQSTCPTHGGVLSEIRELKPGMLIHKTYRIVRKLGQGGMGTVYLADHVLMEESRALKFLSAELSQDVAFTSRFRREVRTLRQVRHKNVVDCGDLEPAEDDSLFFAMEFVDGPDLRSFLRNSPQPFSVPLALSLTHGIAEGLGVAHSLGMVHRDIKPENILMARVGDHWVPKIADFGIVATKEMSAYTQAGASLLTPFYAAPEQWRGTRAAELDGRTDLYALGGVLYEMLTGQKVFAAENYEGWMEQHRAAPPPPPSSLRPDLAFWRGLDDLVVRMLGKNPGDRPRDVAEVLGLLSAVQYVRPVVAIPEAPVAPVATAVNQGFSPVQLPPATVAPKGKRSGGIPGWVWALCLAMVVIVAAGAVVAGRFYAAKFGAKTPDTSVQSLPASTPKPQEHAPQASPPPSSESPMVTSEPKTAAPDSVKPAEDKTAVIAPPKSMPGGAWKPAASGKKASVAEMAQQGNAFYEGQRYSEAEPLLDKACSGGDAASCKALGYMYAKPLGVPQDYSKAVGLYTKACNEDNAAACSNLGGMLQSGSGVARDYSRAASLYQKACNAGVGNACSNLGLMYQHGYGIATDLAKAKELLSKGCSLGNKSGCDWLQQLH